MRLSPKQQNIIGASALIASVALIIWGSGRVGETPTSTSPSNQPASTITMNNNLKITDTIVGTGQEAKVGDLVVVHYTGKLDDGSTFDSSVPRGMPFDFTIGEGRVIAGWEQGVPGMKVGGKRVLVIPPELGYGANGYPPVIPPAATLTFEVELLGIGK